MKTRPGPRQGGFTFVELLVTIIIAGIAFSAMVPLFVQAQKTASADIIHNTALQLAQDKLEKIRGLDYDLITQPGLRNNTIPNGQFGLTTTWATGGGSRSFGVDYVVDYIDKNGNTGATPGTEKYKQVTVTVSWTAPPAPVKPVVLSTMISKQYAGPQIVRVNLGPSTALDTDVGTGTTTIVSGPMDVDVYIAPEDIASMNRAATETNRGYVLFTITPDNGTAIASQKVTLPVSDSDAGHYHFSWDNLTAPNGVYVIQAMAVAGFGSRSQGMPWSLALSFVNNFPAPPTDLAALAGDGSVLLTWTTAAVGGVDHYEVYRSTDGATYAHIGDASTTTSYPDSSVTNGTTYYYKVRTVDTEGLTGAFTAAVAATPSLNADKVPPSVPSPLTATRDDAQPTVHLSWAPSVDGGTPTSGLAGYNLERQQSGSTTWEPLQTLYQGTTYDDTTAGWSTTWTYRVRAVDMVNNQSANATAGPVTTIALILRQIKVTNNSSTQAYVWVQNVATSKWYATAGVSPYAGQSSPPGGVWVKKNGNSVTWTNLPSGQYNVFFKSSSNFGSSLLKTQVVNLGSGDGTATYP